MNINAIIYILSAISVIGGTTFNAGDVKEGTPVIHTFKAVNTGKDTVFITEIRRTCGCTTTETSKKVLLPGDTFDLTVRVNTYGFYGPVSKSVYLFYSTQKKGKKHLKLTIRAHIFKNSETPLNVFRRIKNGMIFDIRRHREYVKCHIAGSENINKDALLSYLKGKNRFDKDSYIFIVAPDSIKGSNTVKSLRKLGYRHSYYIEGGIKKWLSELGKSGLICSD